jgi:hypothetical protein
MKFWLRTHIHFHLLSPSLCAVLAEDKGETKSQASMCLTVELKVDSSLQWMPQLGSNKI